MSWDEAFSQHYEAWSAHTTEDVAFYVELAREADGPLVELAVGNGRVAIPVAQATSRTVIGIDTSPSLLEQAHPTRPRRVSSSTCARATCGTSPSKNPPR